MKLNFKIILIMLCLYAGILQAQDIVKVDPTPLEKPKPFTSIETQDPSTIFNELIDTVIAYGFNINKRDKDELELEARRSDPQTEKAEDRILIWLDRDEEKPLEKVHLFFLYGRYEEVWANNKKDIFRIVISNSYEDMRVGKLKEAILKISMR
jgi:hypothetical protein